MSFFNGRKQAIREALCVAHSIAIERAALGWQRAWTLGEELHRADIYGFGDVADAGNRGYHYKASE